MIKPLNGSGESMLERWGVWVSIGALGAWFTSASLLRIADSAELDLGLFGELGVVILFMAGFFWYALSRPKPRQAPKRAAMATWVGWVLTLLLGTELRLLLEMI